MIRRKIMHIGFLTSMLCHQLVIPSADIKDAIKSASYRASWGWVKSRAMPLIAGAAMVTIPPIAVAAGFIGMLGTSGTGRTETLTNVFAGMMISGTFLSYVLTPLGKLLMARQSFLIGRDLDLFYKFTGSTSYLNPQSLPPADTIANMHTHHQLLNTAKRYFDREGNLVEQQLLTIPGLRGYKADELTV